jgi:hypothetical protein
MSAHISFFFTQHEDHLLFHQVNKHGSMKTKYYVYRTVILPPVMSKCLKDLIRTKPGSQSVTNLYPPCFGKRILDVY